MFRNLPATRYEPENASAQSGTAFITAGDELLLIRPRDSRDSQGLSTGQVRTLEASGFLEILLRGKMTKDGAAVQGVER